MGGFSGMKGWLLVAAVAGIAAGAKGAEAWISGPTVSLGVNPMKTIFFEATFTGKTTNASGQTVVPGVLYVKKLVYEVPQGQVFVLGGLGVFRAPSTAADYGGALGIVHVDGVNVEVIGAAHQSGRRFGAGEVAGPGSKIEVYCYGNPGDNKTMSVQYTLWGTLEAK